MFARILVIEDNPANLELMRYLLSNSGHEVLVAMDGAQGVEVAARERPDVILCDIQLPVFDGYEVLRRLRAMPEVAAIPIVAITALAMVGDREGILARGFDGYLSKPIDPESVVQEVAAYLPAARRGAATSPYASTPAAGIAPDSNERTILALDNLPVNLEFLASLLERFGYRVLVASNPGAALELARRHPPDLIISDVCMPESSGYDFIATVKADPALAAIPLVFLTSTKANETDRARGLALGAVKFLFRPIEPEALLAEIEECLPPRRGA